MYHRISASILTAAAAVVLGACGDTPSATRHAPEPGAPAASALTCQGDRVRLTVECRPAEQGGARSVLLGGQHVNVTLTSSNVVVTADTVAFDVTITNLLRVPMGTADGTTSDPNGVRVFFTSLHTTVGSGQVVVANPDGLGTFTASNQPYFAYHQIIEPAATSAARRWKLRMDPGVTTFQFTVYVSAALPPSSGRIYLSIVSPAANGLVGDTLKVWARVDSATVPATGAWLTADDRTVQMYPWNGYLRADLPLVGRARGPLDLTVVVATADGTAESVTRTVIVDRPPTIVVTGPPDGTVARPEFRLDVDCVDDDPAGCSGIAAWLSFDDEAPVAKGTTGIHAIVSLPEYVEGWSGVRLNFAAGDKAGQQTFMQGSGPLLYRESSTALTEVTSAGLRMLDTDSTRLIYADRDGSVYLRTGGVDQLVATGTRDPRSARLHPYGAIFTGTNAVSGGTWTYDWNAGSLTPLTGSTVSVHGRWAAWSSGYRRDLATATTEKFTLNGGTSSEPTLDGDLVYSGNSHDLWLYHAGQNLRLTSDDDAVHWNIGVTTDGTDFLYLKTNQAGNATTQTDSGHVTLLRGGVETSFARTTRRCYAAPGCFTMTNGWVAYLAQDALGFTEIFVRRPDGTERQATTDRVPKYIAALSSDGSLVYVTPNSAPVALRAIRWPYTTAPVRVAKDWDTSLRPRFLGPDLMYMIGRTAFRVTF